MARPLLIELIIGLSLPLTFGNRFKALLSSIRPRAEQIQYGREKEREKRKNKQIYRFGRIYYLGLILRENLVGTKGKKVSFYIKFPTS